MERYEVNKFIEEYDKRVNDLYEALDIKNKKPLFNDLSKEIKSDTFWNDQEKAQKTLKEFNILKSDIELYDKAFNDLSDIKDLTDMAFTDSEAMDMLTDLIKEFTKYIDESEVKALLSGKYDYNNCILEFHPGAGGTESMDWALMLFRMYQRFCSSNGYKAEILAYEQGEDAGIKSATLSIKGEYAYGYLKGEAGVHRLVRISPFDSNKRRHTSFCSIDVVPEVSDDNEIEIKDEDIRVDTYLSSGHGGQGVNTTYSAVRVTHIPTGIVVTCQNERSQLKNKDTCMKVLRSKLLQIELKKKQEELDKLKGTQMAINFGSQIRSYVFTPYTLVKDHRTNYEVGNVLDVMDGNILGFMQAYLKLNAKKN